MNGWKIAFFVLFIIFIIEGGYLFLVLNSFTSYRQMVVDVQDERIECSTEVCINW